MNASNQVITSKTVLGILGSGQLARMTALAAAELGFSTHIYCNSNEESPAQKVSHFTGKGSFEDISKILEFCETCDVVTLENEFIDQNVLEAIEAKYPDKLFPSAKTFSLIGDKLSEKNAFTQAGIKVAPYARVKSQEDILRFAQAHEFPIVLKSAKGGYDGYGNVTIRTLSEVPEALTKLRGELLVEAYIPYEKELATLVARNRNGEMAVYPIAHTHQENHICHYVCVPAEISPKIEKEILESAQKAMIAIDAIGIFAFEFFLTKEGDLYLNESAPRPHNSGHYSIEGCITSQFQNHVRSVFNLPLGKTHLRAPMVCMLNLLGTQNGTAELSNVKDFLQIPDGHLHLYGKTQSKVGRKMGHFTLLGENQNAMMRVLEKLKKDYRL